MVLCAVWLHLHLLGVALALISLCTVLSGLDLLCGAHTLPPLCCALANPCAGLVPAPPDHPVPPNGMDAGPCKLPASWLLPPPPAGFVPAPPDHPVLPDAARGAGTRIAWPGGAGGCSGGSSNKAERLRGCCMGAGKLWRAAGSLRAQVGRKRCIECPWQDDRIV